MCLLGRGGRWTGRCFQFLVALSEGWDTRGSLLWLGCLMSMAAFFSDGKRCFCFAQCFSAEELRVPALSHSQASGSSKEAPNTRVAEGQSEPLVRRGTSNALSPCLPTYVFANCFEASSASSHCVTMRAFFGSCVARLTKQGASPLAAVSVSVQPSKGQWAMLKGRSKRYGRGGKPGFPLRAPKPGECFSQKLYELPLPFSLLLHLCFFCLSWQHVPVGSQEIEVMRSQTSMMCYVSYLKASIST